MNAYNVTEIGLMPRYFPSDFKTFFTVAILWSLCFRSLDAFIDFYIGALLYSFSKFTTHKSSKKKLSRKCSGKGVKGKFLFRETARLQPANLP